jgi:hypothetical protein
MSTLTSRGNQQYPALTVPEHTSQLFDNKNVMSTCYPLHCIYLPFHATSFRELFTRVEGQFQKMYTRRAFIQSYITEGLKIVQFDKDHSSMTNFIQEYKMYKTSGVDKGGEGEEEE